MDSEDSSQCLNSIGPVDGKCEDYRPTDIINKLRFVDVNGNGVESAFIAISSWVGMTEKSSLIAPRCRYHFTPKYEDNVYKFTILRKGDIFHGFTISPVLKEQIEYVKIFHCSETSRCFAKEWRDIPTDNYVYKIYDLDNYPVLLEHSSWEVEIKLKFDKLQNQGGYHLSIEFMYSILDTQLRQMLSKCGKTESFKCKDWKTVSTYENNHITTTSIDRSSFMNLDDYLSTAKYIPSGEAYKFYDMPVKWQYKTYDHPLSNGVHAVIFETEGVTAEVDGCMYHNCKTLPLGIAWKSDKHILPRSCDCFMVKFPKDAPGTFVWRGRIIENGKVV